MLAVDHLQAAYGPAQVLFDICLRVGAGEVVTLLGRNGMGKTTTIRTLMGLLPACGGSAAFEGVSLIGLPPYRIAQAGLGFVPQGQQIFPTLPVEEARWSARDTRAGAGGVDWRVGGVGGRPDDYGALSAGVTRAAMASAANSCARASATHDVICGPIDPPRERSASASRRFS